MAYCPRCGESVDFITYDGRRIPLHTCRAISASWERLYGFADSFGIPGAPAIYESVMVPPTMCFPTQCPECGREVFFIRHNGGSVWINPPLGWPWRKHECMHREGDVASFADELGALATILDSANKSQSISVGVIDKAAVYGSVDPSCYKRFSILHIQEAAGGQRLVGVDGLHDDIVGTLAFLVRTRGMLYLVHQGSSSPLRVLEDPINPFLTQGQM